MSWTQVKIRRELFDRITEMAEQEGRSTANMLERILIPALEEREAKAQEVAA